MFKTKLHILTGVGAFLFLLFYTLSCGINNNKDTENEEQEESIAVLKYGICVESLDINP